MKSLLVTFVSVGLVALTGCSEFTGNPNATTTTTSAAMSSDSKNMVGDTMTAPEANPANATADVNAIPYPAIHSNGQGAGAAY